MTKMMGSTEKDFKTALTNLQKNVEESMNMMKNGRQKKDPS